MTGETSPLFLLGFHRGGTTFVQRLLNVHRDVALWGENGGLITDLRHAYANAELVQPVERPPSDIPDPYGRFLPWAAPFDRDGLLDAFRRVLTSLYQREGARLWGFKEIRHGNAPDLAFLRTLFPECRIVMVVRHPRDVLMSELRVAWGPSLDRVRDDHYVDRFLSRYARTVRAFTQAQHGTPQLTRLVVYEDLRDLSNVVDVFAWLGLELSAAEEERLGVVRERRLGSSYAEVKRPIDPTLVVELDERFSAAVRELLTSSRPALRDELLGWYPDLETP